MPFLNTEKNRDDAKGYSSRTHVPRRTVRSLVLAVYCVFLLLSSAYLYRLAQWTQTQGIGWIGPSVLKSFIGLGCLILLIQFVRAILKKRFLHVLFLFIIVLSFVPAYLNLERSLERFHLLEYGLLGVLVFWRTAPKRYTIQFYLRALNLLLVMSFFDEVCQGFVPERFYDIQDIWINFFSGTIGILAFRMMDLNVPLPLHPQYRKEHGASEDPPPLIDLHIYGSDLLLLVPIAAILTTNAFLTHSVTRDDLVGIWQKNSDGGYVLHFEENGRVLLDFPLCKLYGTYALGGNVLDGYRISLIAGEDENRLPHPCREAFQKDLRVVKEKTGVLTLHRTDLGTFDRKSTLTPSEDPG